MDNLRKRENPFERKSSEEVQGPDNPEAVEGNFDNFQISEKSKTTLESVGYKYLFPIQQKTFKHIFEGLDIIGKDRTGSGKTLAFTLPTLERMRANGEFVGKRGQTPQVLVLVPTRELAIQVGKEFEKLKNSRDEYRSLTVYGGVDIYRQIDSLRRGVEVIIGTPGRLMDLQDRKHLNLSELKCIILDETDQMLNFGFQEDIEKILKQAKEDLADASRNMSEIQFCLFSATVPRWVEKIASKFMKDNLIRVDMIKDDTIKTSVTVEHLKIFFPNKEQKISSIGDVVGVYGGSHSRTIVFTDTKQEANDIMLNGQLKLDMQVLHGDIPQNQREITFKSFRAGKLKCLVATNVAARGLDIPEVDLIIQLSPPKEIDAYIHRSGRTGRAGKSGVCITFYSGRQESLVQRIEYKTGVSMKKVGVPQPKDIIKASARDIAQSFDNVTPDILTLFSESSKDILQHYTPEEALQRALAIISGYTETMKQRSLLFSAEGYITYLVETDREVRGLGYIWGILRRILAPSVVDSIKGMKMLKNRMGGVFDIKEEYKTEVNEAIAANQDSYTKISIATELPEIEDRNSDRGYGGRNGYGGGNNGYDRRGTSRGNYNSRNRGYDNNSRGGYDNSRGGYDNSRGNSNRGYGNNNQGEQDIDNQKLFVGNLGDNYENELRSFVVQTGYNPTDVYVVKDQSGGSKGFGYVKFNDSETASKAMNDLNRSNINGSVVRVNFAKKKRFN